MMISNEWTEYELIDASRGMKYERWGDIYLLRPDPQIIWDQGDLLENPWILHFWTRDKTLLCSLIEI